MISPLIARYNQALKAAAASQEAPQPAPEVQVLGLEVHDPNEQLPEPAMGPAGPGDVTCEEFRDWRTPAPLDPETSKQLAEKWKKADWPALDEELIKKLAEKGWHVADDRPGPPPLKPAGPPDWPKMQTYGYAQRADPTTIHYVDQGMQWWFSQLEKLDAQIDNYKISYTQVAKLQEAMDSDASNGVVESEFACMLSRMVQLASEGEEPTKHLAELEERKKLVLAQLARLGALLE